MSVLVQSDRETAWQAFSESCRQCQQCSLSTTRKNVVIARGRVPAPLMIIGEGPGADEDAQGIPFVGAAGKLLNLLLFAFDLTDQDYHICNIVKCRPPQNRVPAPDEAAACKPLLAQQFRLVQPRVIVLLGATACQYFLGTKTGITKLRGQWIEKNGYFIMPTFHPAYILRNNNERIRLWQDIGLVRAKLEELGFLQPLDDIPVMPRGRQ
ncbi:MAG: uracil-DNA glycosylase [Clostridia bacterium]|nr:uracil-DNA glycosylase [Eubacteriales bacterium]MDD3866169.1 uracil-DNA glycosylase [Eubacteriales bacterium]MDD4461860.1 uracil-DNA glycosylase [Eubacteriales bacterium]NCC47651.1 uracil-DNA glycosylase [Clostridia bacterium]